jgi:hypothetical protein
LGNDDAFKFAQASPNPCKLAASSR